MPRYEYVEGKSRKFWEIETTRNGNAFTVTFGRIGTAGQKQTKKFSERWDASFAHDKGARVPAPGDAVPAHRHPAGNSSSRSGSARDVTATR